jgi:ADP-ribose pyrophosphatase YjhB (NUDIX family)
MPKYPDDGGPIVHRTPDGDTHPRLVCEECGFIHYTNPLVVVGAVCWWQDRVLLCRRAIEPQSGLWTIPAGYLELGESCAEGAVREAREEAHADIAITALLAVYSIPRISQVQLIHRAALRSPYIAAGEESLEVGLFAWDDIPWDTLAFPSVRWALDHDRAIGSGTDFSPFTNPDGERGDYTPGASI